MINEAFIIIFFALFALLVLTYNFGDGEPFSQSCGHLFNVSTNTYPLGMPGYHSSCGDLSYELVCENNKTVLYVNYGRHLAEATYASNSTTLQSITAGLDNNNCPSITHHSLPYNNFSYAFNDRKRLCPKEYKYYAGGLLFVNCQNPLHPDLYQGIEATCTSEGPQTLHSYVFTWYSSKVPESVAINCIQMSPNDRPSMSRVAEMLQGDVDPSEILPSEPSSEESKRDSSVSA